MFSLWFRSWIAYKHGMQLPTSEAKASWSPPGGWLQYKPLLLCVSGWCMDQTKSQYMLNTFLLKMVPLILSSYFNNKVSHIFQVSLILVIWCFENRVKHLDWLILIRDWSRACFCSTITTALTLAPDDDNSSICVLFLFNGRRKRCVVHLYIQSMLSAHTLLSSSHLNTGEDRALGAERKGFKDFQCTLPNRWWRIV